MKRIDDQIAEIKSLQARLDNRAEIEQQAEALICQCRFEETLALLAALD